MSAKRIGLLERNAGAIAVALAVAGAAGLVVRGWMTSNVVNVPPDITVAPGAIDERLAEEARALLDRMDPAAPPPIDLPEPGEASGQLARTLSERVTPAPELPMRTASRGPSVDGLITRPEVVFNVPEVPTPTGTAATAHLGTIADSELQAIPALAARFGNDAPADLVWNTAAARLDLAALRAQLAAHGEDRPAAPASWSRDRPGLVVDVVVERQEMAGGDWMKPVVLEPLPGRFSVRHELAGPIDAAARDRIVVALAEPGAELELLQPAFYELRGGSWIEPGTADDIDADDDPSRRRLRSLQSRRDELARYLQLHFGITPDEPPDEDAQEGEGGRGIPGPPPGGFDPGDGGTKRNREQSDPPGTDNESIRRLLRQIEQLDGQIRRLRMRIDAAPAPIDEPAPPDDEIWVWAHDITAEPGKVYRYAMQVRVYNPFFGHGRSLVDEQQSLAEAFTLDSPKSAWSAPVATERFTRLWITRADTTPMGGLDDFGTARAEVDRYHDGHLWRETFQVRPGDPIGAIRQCSHGGPPVEVDFRTDLVVVDILGSPDPTWDVATQVLLQNVVTGEFQGLRDPSREAMGAAARPPFGQHPCTDA